MSFLGVIGGPEGGQMDGAKAALPGYNRAIGYMSPYVQGGLADYNRYRGDINNYGDMLSGYGNPADYMWQNAGLSPQQAYQNMMSGYTTSPQAQYQTDQMQKAADRGASASGMMGSGTYFDKLQRNQQDIIAQDQDRWLNNMMGVGDQQMGQVQNFQNQQNNYWNRMQGLTELGFNASGRAADMEIQKAMMEAQAAQGRSGAYGNLINMGLGLASGGGRGFGGYF